MMEDINTTGDDNDIDEYNNDDTSDEDEDLENAHLYVK